jgi:hypothetical protein
VEQGVFERVTDRDRIEGGDLRSVTRWLPLLKKRFDSVQAG